MKGLKNLSLIAMIALAIWPVALPAAERAPDAVEQYVRAEMDRQRIPGLALLVSRAGRVVRTQGFGLANVELQVPVKPETVFCSGSLGKQFTATAVMILVEEGKIGLDDPLTRYLRRAPDAWKKVTIRQLRSHIAGFTDYPKNFNWWDDYTEAELLKIIQDIPFSFPPGTDFAYSNLGYVTLGIIIHKVTGKFYGAFLQERIFRPLALPAARVISEADITPNRAAGYRLVKGQLKNQEWISPTMNTTADGSLHLSVLDLANWDAALYTEKLLKRSSLDQMWTVASLNNGKPNSGNYGFAWVIETRKGHKVVEHDGIVQGFQTQISRYLDDQLTVAVLINLADATPDTIIHRIAEMYLSAKPE